MEHGELLPMKKFKIAYWIVTAGFIYWMMDPTISSAFSYDYAVEFFTKRLGYPLYFLAFTGVTKLVGLIVLLIPGFTKVKEWVYAGFTFDLVAALYSLIAIGMPVYSLWPQTVALLLMTGSYLCFQQLVRRAENARVIPYGN